MSAALSATFDERTLLQIAVADLNLERARMAWLELLQRVGGDAGFLEWVSGEPCERLLPLLGTRVAELDLGPRLRDRCRFEVDITWGLNVRLFEVIGQLVDQWIAAGVVPTVFKGLGLLGDVYPDHVRRAVGDADVLIRPDEIRPALDVLARGDWEVPWRAVDRLRLGATALGIRHPSGVGLDLHLRPARDLPYRRHPDPLPAEPVPASHPLAGSGLLRLSPAAHALVLCLHLIRYTNRHVGHPLVDLYRLVAQFACADDVDLVDEVEAAARRAHAEFRVADQLARLGEVFDPTPLGALGAVQRPLTVTEAERRAIEANSRLAAQADAAQSARRRVSDHVRNLLATVTLASVGRGPATKVELVLGHVLHKTVQFVDEARPGQR